MVHKQSQEGRRGSEKGETEIRIEPKLMDAPALEGIRERTGRLNNVLSEDQACHQNGREYAYFSVDHDPSRPMLEQSHQLRLDIQRTIWDLPKMLTHIKAQEQTIEAHNADIEALTAENTRLKDELAHMQEALDSEAHEHLVLAERVRALGKLLDECWDVCHSYSLMGKGTPNEEAITSAAQSLARRINEIRAAKVAGEVDSCQG